MRLPSSSPVPDRFAESTSADVAAFERFVAGLVAPGSANDDSTVANVAVTLARALAAAGAIGPRERDRRLRVVLAALRPSHAAYRLIAEQAASSDHVSVSNALRSVLPAELRRRTGAATAIGPVAPSSNGTAGPEVVVPGDSPSSVPSDVVVAHGTFPVADQGADETTDDTADDKDAHRAVALVGVPAEHDNNRAMLIAAHLKPLPVGTIAELSNLAATGLCGFVVGQSVWSSAPPETHSELVAQTCAVSTELFTRVATDGLSPAAAARLPVTAGDVRCGPVDASRFCHGGSCQLTPGDVETLRTIARRLAEVSRTSFRPLGLSVTEATLLRLVASSRTASRGSEGSVRTLGTRELGGGRSSARMYLVRPADNARPIVFKLDGLPRLKDEVSRYRRWIAPWEAAATDARLHCHLGSSAVVYHMQSNPDAADEPAATLEDRVVALRTAESWAQDAEADVRLATAEADLKLAVGRCVDQLAALAKTATDGAAGDVCWRHWPVANLSRQGISLDLDLLDGSRVPLRAIVEEAARRVDRLGSRAATHGDIHGRNVLIVDRVPAFVDFAQSGPGHPCHDLACLDATVRMHAMRLACPDADLAGLYHELYVSGRSEGELRRSWPAAFTSATSRLAIATACRTRAAAMETLATYGGQSADYLSMLSVVSAYAFAHLQPGSGVERALLSAVAATI